ncbi:hypothetical protein [Eudoraea adriatica]|uniref:hypothetical protein n=1 Tax=Eudoraea adriatica TaxID=446681 RepID=UPI00039A3AFE|nr:hypothetical protein [Eudoraea adriatica]
MQTCRICFVMLASFLIGCSDNTDGYQESKEEFPNLDATYSLLFETNGLLSLIKLSANAEAIFPDPGISEFESILLPSVTYRNGDEISLFHSLADCSGNISLYNFKNDALKKTVVFDDLRNCDLIVHALAHYGNMFYIGYEVPGTGAKETLYYARIIDSSPTEPEFFDIEIDKKPLQAIVSNNRVFVLSEDMEDSYRNYLLVYDTQEEEFTADINLGFEAQKLFKSDDGNIIVSYPEMHNFVSSSTMAIVKTTRYEEGKEPGFADSEASFSDEQGNLYYSMQTDYSGTSYPNIPAVYDFQTNTAILYYYENFLSEQEQLVEFKIGSTTMVSYDAKNNLVLIGYKKAGDPDKGGLLRIRPIPNPAFIDNIDVNGVPFQLYTD